MYIYDIYAYICIFNMYSYNIYLIYVCMYLYIICIYIYKNTPTSDMTDHFQGLVD